LKQKENNFSLSIFPKNTNLKTPSVDSVRKKHLVSFERIAGLRFRRLDLLNLAFCHRSYTNETTDDIDNNEKLEFLGDSVLGVIVADYLFCTLPDRPEGDLAKIKSFVVSEKSLSVISKTINIDRYVLIGKGEERSGGRTKKALLADCLEAVIGAYYLDSGYKDTIKFVLKYLIPEIDKVLADKHVKDFKTLLQEYVQKTYKSYPKYLLIEKTGPDHNRTYWMEVSVAGTIYGPGNGKNKKDAEQNAASLAYQALVIKAES